MHTDNEFFQAVLADPDDLIPRLIYADWLDEQGDPRGEFIRVQCELADMPETAARRRALLTRESELLHQHKQKWHSDVHRYFGRTVFQEQVSKRKKGVIRNWRFGRGLVEHLSISVEALKHPDDLFGVGPLRSLDVSFTSAAMDVKTLFDEPRFQQIRQLRVWNRGYHSLEGLIRQILQNSFVLQLESLRINDEWYQDLFDRRAGYSSSLPVLDNLLPIENTHPSHND